VYNCVPFEDGFMSAETFSCNCDLTLKN